MILGIRFLTGYYVARDLTLQQAEWPTQSARVFMAMAATHFETGADPAEREALLWLESQPAPQIFASLARFRSTVETYVPVNDQHGGILKRPRQSRSFPAVRPDNDSVYLFWNNEPDTEVRSAIERLCAKVTRIGHSSSLTQMWVSDATEAPAPNWQPTETNPHLSLRVPERGLLQYLEQSFNGKAIEEYFLLTEKLTLAKGAGKTALKNQIKQIFGDEVPQPTRPIVNTWRGYQDLELSKSAAGSACSGGPFDPEFIVLARFEGRSLGLESTLQLTLALRSALLTVCPKPQPEWLTGHAPDGSPSKHPHMAFFPLPFVGTPHADGHIMGLGIALPNNLIGENRPNEQAFRESIGPLFFNPTTRSPRELKLWKETKDAGEKAWLWELQRELRQDPPLSLKASTWAGPSDCWASVTPVVLHHYPNKAKAEDVERILRDAFKSALLPDPESIQVSVVSAHTGAGSLRDVPAFTEGSGLTRYSTHVVATFPHKVTGPMLVGRGRFRGYGLFRPLNRKEAAR
jgi:CRISPR-associated protein Csb2